MVNTREYSNQHRTPLGRGNYQHVVIYTEESNGSGRAVAGAMQGLWTGIATMLRWSLILVGLYGLFLLGA